MSDDDLIRPGKAGRRRAMVTRRAGTAVQDTADVTAEPAADATTTANLPVVDGSGEPYVDRNGRATRGSTGASAVGARPAASAVPAGAFASPSAHEPAPRGPGGAAAPPAPVAPSRPTTGRPPAPSAVDQYAALGLTGGPATASGPAAPVAPSGALPPPAATSMPTSTARRPRAERTPRRARLQLRHFNVWTVFKFSVVLAVALFFVWLIIVAVLYGTLDHLQAIDKINRTVRTIENDSSTNDAVTPRVVFTAAFLIGLVNIVVFIALSTIGAVVYNLCADLVGGVEVTLAERD